MVKEQQTVEEYVADRSVPVRATLEALRQLIQSTLPDFTEGMKWGAPIYARPDGQPLVYLYGGKDHVNVGFLRGAELDDPEGLLEGRGESTRIVKINASDEIPEKEMCSLLCQSAKLQPDPEA